MTDSALARLRGNAIGGLTAAVLAVPVCVGFGILALAPLGPQYVQHGVLAGLYGAVCGGFTAALLGGGRGTIIYSPRGIVTFLISTLVAQNIVTAAHAAGIRDADTLMGLVFLMVLASGALQLIYGALKLGILAKYLPAPVLAGFQTAGSILIFVAQIPIMLGLPEGIGLAQLPGEFSLIQPLTILVGLAVCVAMLLMPRFIKSFPSNFGGLLAGVVVFYALALLGLREHLGPLIGAIPWSMPSPKFLFIFHDLLTNPDYHALLPLVLSGAASLSVVGTLDTLLGARIAERRLGERREGNRELVTQGIANMISASFGGISTGINMAASDANQRSGGTTPASVLIFAGVIASGLLLPLIALIPRVVIAAMMIAAAIQLFDRWTLQMAGKLFKDGGKDRDGIITDLSIVAIVATLAIAANIGLAVLMGFVVTLAVFLVRISKSVIRREYSCDMVHSRKTREPRQMALLAERGGKVVVLELEGPVFFGTSDTLSVRLDQLAASGSQCVILDLKRVNEMDSSGARVILAAFDKITGSARHMLLSGAATHAEVATILRDMGVTAALGAGRMFDDADTAIEWAEERLILTAGDDTVGGGEFALARFDVLAGMNGQEIAQLQDRLARKTWASGAVVFNEGDTGRDLYMITQGSASVRINVPGMDDGAPRSMRLVTFAPGTIFGEIALLDDGARSATVEADGELICYVLSHEAFTRLSAEQPAMAIKLLANLGRELGSRLRRANRTIYQLDS